MRTARRIATILCALALAVIPLASPAADPYQIDAILSQTGNLAFVGKIQKSMLEAVESMVNQSGGIKGRPLQFVFADDQSNPQTAVQLLNGFLAKNPPVILGSTSAGSCNAMFPLVAKGPVMYCLSSAVAPVAGGWGFASNSPNLEQIAAGIRYLRLRGWTRIATISATDAVGQIYDTNIDAALALPENKGAFTVVAREHLNPTDVSAGAQIAHIKATNAQVLVVGATGNAAGTVFHAVTDVGLDLPVVTGSGNANIAAMRQWSGFLPKPLYFLSYAYMAPNEMTDPGMKVALRVFFAAIKAKGVESDGLLSSAWDPALIVTTALRKLGPTATASQVREFIANLSHFYGANGEYNFKQEPQRGVGQDGIVITLWDPVKGTWNGVSNLGGAPNTR